LLRGGGGGGAGGWGAVVTGGGALGTLSVNVTGGAGGAGGSNVFLVDAGSGGTGGIGLAFTGANVTATIGGNVAGGNGGFHGSAFESGTPGADGAGGVGITGSGLTLTITGTVSGGLSGDGVTRADAIDFTGGTNALTLNPGWGLTGNVNVASSLAFVQSTDATLSNVITGAGSISKSGGGALTLSGANTYTGGTTIAAGTLQLGNGGTTGSIVGNVLDNGMFAIDHSDAVIFGAVISGSGGFQQLGAGTTTLTGTNTYTGTTTVSAGTLTISGTGSITSDVTNIAAFNNAGTVTGSLTNNGTASNSGTISNGLTNSAGTTTNTGTINGGLINNAVVNADSGAINGAIANNAGSFNVGGTVTSNSTFTNAADATLAVGTTGAYTLQGILANSGIITVASGGELVATVGGITNNAGATITVAAGGTVKDDLNNAGAVTNGGAYMANVATNTGAITNNGVWTGNVASNTGTITNNMTWTGTVTNAGTFNNNAGATVSGLLTNSAGTTNNAGALNGGVNITGGTLTGSGSVSNLTVAGGTLAPGNGTPGTFMTVSGNLAFQSGVQYLVQLNPATASFANVTGTATLGGATVNAMYANGSYVAKTYTILTATGGVSGTFGPLVNTNLPANFKTSLSYDAQDAFLNLTLIFVPPPNSGLNQNQQNVANAIVGFFNANGGIPLIFGGLTPAGLSQASGEIATATQQTTFDAMNQFMGLLTDPFVAGRGDPVTSRNPAPQYAEGNDGASAYADNGKQRSKGERDAYAAIYRKAPLAAPFVTSWSVWAAGFGGSQTTDGNVALGSNNTSSSIAGTAVGADYRFSPFTVAGFALAGGGTNFNVANAGTGRSDLFQAGAYVRHTAGAVYVTAALAYGWQDITTDRFVTVAGVDHLRAEFNANAYSGRVEGGYRFVTPWMGVTPYAAGQFTTFDLPAYAEQAVSGASTFALAYGSQSVTDARSELGLRTDKSWALTNSILTLRGRFAWAYDYDPNRSIAATFQALPGASFVVNGAAQAHDSALTTASAEMKWANGWSAAATFEGAFSQVTNSYAGKGVVRYTW
jgi:fibronectin-binding autotransporter adhesin